MAVLAHGRILLEGAPLQLIDSLAGRIWRKAIANHELEDWRARCEVISSRLFAGRTVIHVLADAPPAEDFIAVAGGLEDVYFTTLASDRAA